MPLALCSLHSLCTVHTQFHCGRLSEIGWKLQPGDHTFPTTPPLTAASYVSGGRAEEVATIIGKSVLDWGLQLVPPLSAKDYGGTSDG